MFATKAQRHEGFYFFLSVFVAQIKSFEKYTNFATIVLKFTESGKERIVK